jgi:hypothetical protein
VVFKESNTFKTIISLLAFSMISTAIIKFSNSIIPIFPFHAMKSFTSLKQRRVFSNTLPWRAMSTARKSLKASAWIRNTLQKSSIWNTSEGVTRSSGRFWNSYTSGNVRISQLSSAEVL